MRNDLELEISHQNYSAESSIVELEKSSFPAVQLLISCPLENALV